MSLLSVKDVSLSFGGVRALDSVSLELNQGEILGLIGPNGAGKTTLFNCISGVLRPDHGQIRFEDQPILRLKPHERAQRGIARTFQDLQVWHSMTVLENCQLPFDALSGRSTIADALRLPWANQVERESIERARAVLHSLDLLEHSERLAGDLPVGLQRRVEIARALAMKPKLILLDEPASGLDADETNALAAALNRIRDKFNVSMLLVDHDMSLVMRACDYLYVLDFGELISTGRPERVREDPRVIEAYLGAAAEATTEAETVKARPKKKLEVLPPVSPQPLLEVKDMSAGYGGIEVIRGISLTVGRGEIVACIGANGAGKTTTLRAISGILRTNRGKVTFDGKDITRKAPEAIVRLGMVHIPQGRGLFPQLTVAETLRLASYSGAASVDLTPALDAFPMLKTRLNQAVGTLSGGQQQMVALARALLVQPKLLFLDEMSQGLAPAVVQQLFERIELFRKSGTSVFLVEQFVDSALAIADRAYVFEQGSVAVEGPASVMRRDRDVIAGAYLGTAVAMAEVSSNGNGHHASALLADLSIKLPAELKRAVQERAASEGKDPGEMIAELLAAGGRAK
ncbi:MAG TPA: ATP-binding cassette domain-containing protein [Candidatus Solibacter sp.]|jgi:branched-chain amino acid transport system ATP-binding protein|nr:ATP-binding cassette domain-containing protein [Candidatus Solibacter sp.]